MVFWTWAPEQTRNVQYLRTVVRISTIVGLLILCSRAVITRR